MFGFVVIINALVKLARIGEGFSHSHYHCMLSPTQGVATWLTILKL